MIYRAIQLIQIFLADGRTDGRTDGLTKVIQEVLADLKNGKNKTRWNIIGAVVKFSIDFLFFVSSMVLSTMILILPLTMIWNLVGIRKFFTEPCLVIFFYIFGAECDKINQQQTGNESGSTKGFFTFLGCVRLLYSLILMYYSNSKDDIGNPERNTTSLLQITPIECKDILDV